MLSIPQKCSVSLIHPLYCPKCKQEILIQAKDSKIVVIKEPDA
ncbi:cysteine-rich KTR domain-containing protein [Acutalibacter muris]